MKVKSLKKWLTEIPDNWELDISKLFVLTGEEDVLECVLDFPIVAIASSKEYKHFRFMIDTKDLTNHSAITSLGKLYRIKK